MPNRYPRFFAIFKNLTAQLKRYVFKIKELRA